jgi:hypothetical protein
MNTPNNHINVMKHAKLMRKMIHDAPHRVETTNIPTLDVFFSSTGAGISGVVVETSVNSASILIGSIKGNLI